MISSTDLTWMRAEQAKILPDTCTIQQKGEVANGVGGHTVTYTTRASGVACRLDETFRQTREMKVGDKQVSVSQFRFFLPANQTVVATDRILVGSRTFEVIGTPHGSWEVGRPVDCFEVK